MSETPAIAGGTPVRAAMLPYGRQLVDDDDTRAVIDALRSDYLTTGPRVAQFEAAFAAAVGARHAIAVSNGTAALHAAAFAAGIGPGDEAITTPLTFAATSNCVLYQGGSPVFADVRADTLNLDPARVEPLITPRTRALIPVSYTGLPPDMDAFRDLADRHCLVLIHDAAHALGARYRGRAIGTLATMTAFSLHPVKHVTTGEGGVVATDDDNLAAKVRAFRSHGMTRDSGQRERVGSWFYEITALGYNYRLTDIQCALGLSQLAKLDRWVARRREISSLYASAFAGHPCLELPTVPGECEPAWHLYVVRLRLDRLTADRATIFAALRAENIGVNVHYIPVPWHPLYARAGYRRGSWPIAEAAYERMVTLPLWPGMTDADVDDVVRAVNKVLAFYAR